MDFGVASWSLFFHLVPLVLLISCWTSESWQFRSTTSVKPNTQKNTMGLDHQQAHHDHHNHNHNHNHNHHDQTPMHMHVDDSSKTGHSYSPFFTTTDLKLGARMALKFPPNLDASASYFLPKDEADSTPFSLEKLQEILELFSLRRGSPQAKNVEDSLRSCESPAIEGETKFCATSMESLVDLANRFFFGVSDPQITDRLSVLASTFLGRPSGPALQNYTVLEAPEEVAAKAMMGCHVMAYPYAVFYCHHQGGRDRVFRVLLGGDSGDRVRAVAACHDTIAKWDPSLAAFRKVRVPEKPLCHFFPPHGNFVWLYSDQSIGS